MICGKRTQTFPKELTKFALTLNFHSPAAYNYVRQSFMKCLPHPKTISKLYECINGTPGFTVEARDAVKEAVRQARDKGQGELLCSLMCDEMNIRKQLVWTGSGCIGHADCGAGVASSDTPLAKEAWVFMLVAINGSWKIPVGYFFIHSLNSVERANVVHQCLNFLHESGVTVASLTFDGNSTNICMAEVLGAGLTPLRDWHPHFSHPQTNKNIYILLDAAHMLKLWRNIFGNPKLKIFDLDGNEISWRFVVKLHELQDREGLLAGNRVRKRHIYFENNKMKVRLAAQLLSTSTADALDYLNYDLKLAEFQNSEATVKFIRQADIVFDILNSKNFLAKKKINKPLSSANIHIVKSLCQQAKEYILGLQVASFEYGRWQPPLSILNSVWKTGFLGFLCCMDSVLGLYSTWVETQHLRFIPTYKLSQDHLETFFCAVRSRGGWNNNPNAQQFISAYKRLLVQVQLGGKHNANCFPLDSTKILNVTTSSRHRKITLLEEADEAEDDGDDEFVRSHDPDRPLQSLQVLTPYVSDVVGYISGFVTRSMSKRIKCSVCDKALYGDVSTSALITRKTRGGLVIPSADVETICKKAEIVIRENALSKMLFAKDLPRYIVEVRRRLAPGIFSELDNQHESDSSFLDNHRALLINSIIKKYVIIRLCHDIKKLNESLLKSTLRNRLNRTVIFRGE